MTQWAAAQYGEQERKGTLEVGKLADLVILDRDPLKVDPMAIKEIHVIETVKEGDTIFPMPAEGFPKVKKPVESDLMVSWRRHICDMAAVNTAADKTWILTMLNGQEIATDRPPTMKFTKGRLHVFGGVNRLTGSYALLDNRVVMGELASTRMAGPPESMKLERNFARTLALVDGFHVHENELALLRQGKPVAKFSAEE